MSLSFWFTLSKNRKSQLNPFFRTYSSEKFMLQFAPLPSYYVQALFCNLFFIIAIICLITITANNSLESDGFTLILLAVKFGMSLFLI